MENKRGSHVGVMLSFAIFIISLVYLYSIIEPAIANSTDYQIALENLKLNLDKKISGNVTSLSVYVKSSITKSCIELQNLDNLVEGDSLFAEDSAGRLLSYSISGTSVKIGNIDSSEKLLKIYSSNEFTSSPASLESCQVISSNDYSIGSIFMKKQILTNKINDFADDFADDYEGLKNDLEVPLDNDFSFSFTYGNSSIVSVGDKNLSSSVYASEREVQYFDSNLGIKRGVINIKLW